MSKNNKKSKMIAVLAWDEMIRDEENIEQVILWGIDSAVHAKQADAVLTLVEAYKVMQGRRAGF